MKDPHSIFAEWMDEATQSEPRVPDAMQLVTVHQGRPSVRTVLLKQWGPEGWWFYTNLQSRKAQEILTNSRVALCLHWKSLARQVLAEGVAAPASAEDNDRYFAQRPRGSQLGAWASEQSAVLPDRDTLIAAVDAVTAHYEGQPVPRPPHWGGFRVALDRIEFWQGRPDRLHERVVFDRTPTGPWIRTLLSP